LISICINNIIKSKNNNHFFNNKEAKFQPIFLVDFLVWPIYGRDLNIVAWGKEKERRNRPKVQIESKKNSTSNKKQQDFAQPSPANRLIMN